MFGIAFLRPIVRILKFPETPHKYFLYLQASVMWYQKSEHIQSPVEHVLKVRITSMGILNS